jgi:hypothetical protein
MFCPYMNYLYKWEWGEETRQYLNTTVFFPRRSTIAHYFSARQAQLLVMAVAPVGRVDAMVTH